MAPQKLEKTQLRLFSFSQMPCQSTSQHRTGTAKSHSQARPLDYSSTGEDSKQSSATVCFGVRKDLFFLVADGPSDQGALGHLPVVFAGGLAMVVLQVNFDGFGFGFGFGFGVLVLPLTLIFFFFWQPFCLSFPIVLIPQLVLKKVSYFSFLF